MPGSSVHGSPSNVQHSWFRAYLPFKERNIYCLNASGSVVFSVLFAPFFLIIATQIMRDLSNNSKQRPLYEASMVFPAQKLRLPAYIVYRCRKLCKTES